MYESGHLSACLNRDGWNYLNVQFSKLKHNVKEICNQETGSGAAGCENIVSLLLCTEGCLFFMDIHILPLFKGNSGLETSQCCLGGMNKGEQSKNPSPFLGVNSETSPTSLHLFRG